MKCFAKIGIVSYDWMGRRIHLVCQKGHKCLLELELTPTSDIKRIIKDNLAKAVNYSPGWFDYKLRDAIIDSEGLTLYYTCIIPYEPATLTSGYEYVNLDEVSTPIESELRNI